MSAESTSEPPLAEEKSEGQQVIEVISSFQSQLRAMQSEISALDSKINKEMPEQLDQAFKEIHDNFLAIQKGLEAIPRSGPSTVAAAAGQGQPQGSGIMGIIENIINRVTQGGGAAAAGGLSEFDKEILKTSKAIQLLTLRDTLKKVAKSAGVELAEHIVVSP